MTVQINYKNSKLNKNPSNLVLFVDEKFNISGLKKYISNTEFSYISDLLKNSDLRRPCFQPFQIVGLVALISFIVKRYK